MMSIEDFDRPYREFVESMPEKLQEVYKHLVDGGPLPTEGNQITRAILLRMKSYYVSQDNIHLWLDKNVKPAAADLFVEVVLFYLKAFVETHHLDLTVDSEKKIEPKPRSPVRPDICVKRGEAVVAIIECKTQLGWDRVNWQNNFIERERILQEVYPDAHAFLVVLTSKNWGGLPLALKDGGQFFVLTNVWPSDINPDNLHDAIGNRIEPLFRQILALSESRPG